MYLLRLQPFVAVCAPLLSALLAMPSDVGATLPASVGTGAAVPGDPAPSFNIPILPEEPDSSNATLNATSLAYNAGATPLLPGARDDIFPLLVVAVRQDDPFTTYMTTATESIDKFLSMGPAGCHFLFTVYDGATGSQDGTSATSALAARVRERVRSAPDAVAQQWAGRLHFTNGSGTSVLGPALLSILTQWQTPQNIISLGSAGGDLNVSRLDVEYATGAWPTQNQAFTLSNAGPCGMTADKGQFGFVSLDTSAANCTPSAAAAAVTGAGGTGVVIAQRSGEIPVPIGRDTSDPFVGFALARAESSAGGVATMIGSEDGAKVSQLLAHGPVNASFASPGRIGEFIAIGHNGLLHECGWQKYDSLQMLGWQAEWMAYQIKLDERLSAPALVVPVFDKAVVGSTATVRIPAQSVLQEYAGMELDFSLECSTTMDRDCSVWDRQIHLTVDCAESAGGVGFSQGPVEIGRWINSFARKGHWVTASPFAPLLGHPNGKSTLPVFCNFSTSVGMGDHWLSTLKLRFPLVDRSDDSDAAPGDHVDDPPMLMMPTAAVPIVYPNNGQGFNSKDYNANRTISIEALMPAGTKRVGVAAIISGHGGCEFRATSHHFLINGRLEFNTLEERYFDRFMQAGTPYGCANKTIRGAVPNEHGTWYLGRNGWCDGLDVKPLVWDVTKGIDLAPGATNTLQYFGWSYGDTDDPARHSEDGCGGTMNMISFLLFFDN